MSKIKLTGNASGTGTLTIAAPNTNSDRTLTLPDGAGELVTSDSNGVQVSAGNPFLELQGTSATSGDTGIFINANANHWILKADNYSSTNQFQIKQGDTSSSTATLAIDSSSNLKFNSGYGSVATAYGVRAWISFNGNASGVIHGSGGVSSYVRTATGTYDINWSSTQPDSNYAIAMVATESRVDRNFAFSSNSTTRVTVVYEETGGSRVDGSPCMLIMVR